MNSAKKVKYLTNFELWLRICPSLTSQHGQLLNAALSRDDPNSGEAEFGRLLGKLVQIIGLDHHHICETIWTQGVAQSFS